MKKSELKALIKEMLDEEGLKMSDNNIDEAKFLLFLEEYSSICERYGVMLNTDILLKNSNSIPVALNFNKQHMKEFLKDMKFLIHGQDI